MIKGEYEKALVRVNAEQEKWADQLLNQLYRDKNEYKRYVPAGEINEEVSSDDPLQSYLSDWKELQKEFFASVGVVS